MVAFWQFGLVGIVAVAMTTDLQTRKIYNWLTFPAMLAGLLLNVALGGMAGLQSSLLGFGIAVLFFLAGFLVGAMGAGDVKLMAAIGLWLGWPYALTAVLYVTIIGGLISLGAAAANGSLKQMFKNIYWFFVGLLLPGGKASAAITESAAPPIPYGVSIAIGTLLALLVPEVNDLTGFFFRG